MDNNAPLNANIREETGGVTYEGIRTETRHEEARRSTESIATITSTNHPTYAAVQPGEQGGVNVSRAEAEFAELSKELSRTSHISRRLSRAESRHSKKQDDVEKAVDSETSSEETFDLETVLRGNRDEEERAGIKSKHIGVIWENLTVSGIGGVKNYVKTFPESFVSFFNVFETAMNLFGLGKKGREFDILKGLKGVAKPGEMVLVLGRSVDHRFDIYNADAVTDLVRDALLSSKSSATSATGTPR
jgi:hypothetical protein